METIDPEEPAFVIDLRSHTMREVEREIEAASAGAFVPRVLPPIPPCDVHWVALLIDESKPLLLAIAPTRDVRALDALGRLLHFAVARGIRVREVIERYGSRYERELLDRGALPSWALEGIDPEKARGLPRAVLAAIGSKTSEN